MNNNSNNISTSVSRRNTFSKVKKFFGSSNNNNDGNNNSGKAPTANITASVATTISKRGNANTTQSEASKKSLKSPPMASSKESFYISQDNPTTKSIDTNKTKRINNISSKHHNNNANNSDGYRSSSPTHSNSSVPSLSKKIDNNSSSKSTPTSSSANSLRSTISNHNNTGISMNKKKIQSNKISDNKKIMTNNECSKNISSSSINLSSANNPITNINSNNSMNSTTTISSKYIPIISNANSNSTTSITNCQRFIIFEDGTHEHHLKNAKRQEKLSTMLRNIVGSQQKLRSEARSAVPDIILDPINNMNNNKNNYPPTLFSGLVKQMENMNDKNINYNTNSESLNDTERNILSSLSNNQSEPSTQSVNIKKQNSLSFAEKYGRCQEVLGKGAFGVVRICHKKAANKNEGENLYAVKEFKRNNGEPADKYAKRLTSEFCISSSLHHPNIVSTLDLFQDAKGEYCEVMEYCAGGDLFSLIVASGKLEYMEADCFFKQLIRGVVYMHDMGVCHRDLKPENLLLTSNGTLKITDFGNSECFKMAWEKDIYLSGGVCGSTPYIAPEEYTHEEFDPRPVDIWACGVIYMAMRSGRQLWTSAKKDDQFYKKYLRGRKEKDGYEPIEMLKRARCRNVIYSMLDPVPHRRITGKQILNSEWGREIKVCHERIRKTCTPHTKRMNSGESR